MTTMFGQERLNIELLSQLPYPTYGTNDIWGYADGDGNEYALVGLDSAISVVDVTDPTNPVEQFKVYGPLTVWRDLKTWDHYAYVTHDITWSGNTLGPQGLVIIDLDSMDNPVYTENLLAVDLDTIVDTLRTAHNLYIDENGICYVFGSNVAGGGALMFDLKKDPWNPEFIGIFNRHYLHDGMARGDTLWGAAIYYGHLLAIDVSDKQNPQIIGEAITPNFFTHNCWVSDDGKTVFTTDEREDSYVAAYDVSNLPNVKELGRIQRKPDSASIPHNTHVYGDFLVTSYYSTGVQIVHAKYPEVMVEVGYYDTYLPNDGPNFNGNWGAYPYLPSGTLLVSDRQSGLFVFNANYVHPAYIEFHVSDYLTGESLFNSQLVFSSTKDTAITDFDAIHKKGRVESGWDTVLVTRNGYKPREIPFYYEEGIYKRVELRLLKEDSKVTITEQVKMYPNPVSAGESLSFVWPDDAIGTRSTIEIYSVAGQLISNNEVEVTADLTIDAPLKSGMYMVRIKNSSRTYEVLKVLVL